MKAAVFESFQGEIKISSLADPTPVASGVVIRVKATGLCRSDWHGWMGHDEGISLPHVPGHEFSGVIESVGKNVSRWRVGDRVTAPFVCACGSCNQCNSGNHQVCDEQFQPGFTNWGSFAEYVAIDFAETNLVRLPDTMDFETAASLGCRFVTSFRAVVDQGKVRGGQWIAIHGCGGVGLSAVMIARAIGARVIAVDINEERLRFAKEIGAEVVINARNTDSVANTIKEISKGGVEVSIDALGSTTTCINSILSLAKRGKHIQVGLLLGENATPPIPMGPVVANELEILGSHGMQAFRYKDLLEMIDSGVLDPSHLIGRKISLYDAALELPKMPQDTSVGITLIDKFE